jgi:transcriptional regulator with XRE-family HTH domain
MAGPGNTIGSKKPRLETFPGALQAIREDLGLTRADLEKRTGLPPNTIYLYEKARREPTLAILVRLADALDASTDAVLGISKPRRPRALE